MRDAQWFGAAAAPDPNGPRMILFVDRIRHRMSATGRGFAGEEQEIREALDAGVEFTVEAGKRAELTVPAGAHPVVYVLEGSVRFEGDDTAAAAGDVVWFRQASEAGLVAVEADASARGVLVHDASRTRAAR